MSNVAEDLHLDVDYSDDELQEQIETGSTQALGWIRSIRADGETIVGGADSEGMREYLTSFFGGLLQCLVEVLDGERAHFTTGNGPIYVVLEPETDDAIRITFAYKKESIDSPSARESFEPSVVVRVDSFVTEVIERANEFLEYVDKWNPELAESSSAFRGIREDTESLDEAYQSWKASSETS